MTSHRPPLIVIINEGSTPFLTQAGLSSELCRSLIPPACAGRSCTAHALPIWLPLRCPPPDHARRACSPEAETYIAWFAVVVAVFYCRVFIQSGFSDTAYLRRGKCASFFACFTVFLRACAFESRLRMARVAFGRMSSGAYFLSA